jgi:hypothetical protein
MARLSPTQIAKRDRATAAVRSRISRMKQSGLSQREIGRRIGISESFLRDLLKGRRRVSTARGVAAGLRPAREVKAGRWMRTVVRGGTGMSVVDPSTHTGQSRIGRYDRAVLTGARTGDFAGAIGKLSRSDLEISTSHGPVHLEDDPERLRELDEAGLLDLEDVLIGFS